MRTTFHCLLTILGLMLTGPAHAGGVAVDLLKMPLRFEAGPERPDVPDEFVARGPGYAVQLTPGGVRLQLQVTTRPAENASQGSPVEQTGLTQGAPCSSVRLNLVGANHTARLTGMEELPGKVNYFRGNDPAKWRRNVLTYGSLRCEEVYPGIDLVYYGTSQEQLEYDFVVAPGADPARIALEVDGADHVEVDPRGDLVVEAAGGQMRLRKPVIYQTVNGTRQSIAGGYVLREEKSEIRNPKPEIRNRAQVAFEVATYDPALPLVIDPVLSYSTYFGGSEDDLGNAIAVDSTGHAYVAGTTSSSDFPIASGIDTNLSGPGDRDAFVVKLTPDGSGIVYATYLGSYYGDQGLAIAVDNLGNACLTGNTGSDFPTTNAFQPTAGGAGEVFVAKLNAAGDALLYSTFLGGSGSDGASGIAVDSDGNVYVTGVTESTNFPVINALQQGYAGKATVNGPGDAFVVKLNASGSALVYSTYLGGTGDDNALGIAVDLPGNAYVTGWTTSANFPSANAFQNAFGGGPTDTFVAKLNPAGSALGYSTYLGGNGIDGDANGRGGIAIDSAGSAYVTGYTTSTNFPLEHPIRRFLKGGNEAFVSKLTPGGTALVYSTLLGGNRGAQGNAIVVDNAGNAYVAGSTRSSDFPTVNPVQATPGGPPGYNDGFISKLDPDGASLLFSSYVGGGGGDTGHYDFATGIAVGADRSIYVIGLTETTDFPTSNSLQATNQGKLDAFIARITDMDLTPPALLDASAYGNPTEVVVVFSEALDPGSATNVGNYSLDNGAQVLAAATGCNSKTVRLTTSPLTNGTTYTLAVIGVQDRAPAPNTVAANTSASFTALPRSVGFVRRELFLGIPGTQVSDLTNDPRFPQAPDAITFPATFESPINLSTNHGVRLSGLLLPPLAGEYRFYLCAYDQGELSLSRDESPANKRLLAWEPIGYPQSRNWNTVDWRRGYGENVSQAVWLEAGRSYYIEALMKAGGLENHLAVAWQLPGGAAPLDGEPPISGDYLAVLANPESATIGLTEQPRDASVEEGREAVFTVRAATSSPDARYQWLREGMAIDGAGYPSYTTPAASLADSGTRYRCVVSVPGVSVTSSEATLTVTNDLTPPSLVSAEGSLGLSRITLTFSEPIDPSDATNLAHYALSGGLSVTGAKLRPDRRTVVLRTDPQTSGIEYTVTLNGIHDRSSSGNAILDDSHAPFIAWIPEEFVGPFPSWADLKRDYGAVGDGIADDTAALQQALNELANEGYPHVLYLPAGIYRITQELTMLNRVGPGIIGEDPATTTILWDGPQDGVMLSADGVTHAKFSRLTWDGNVKASCAVLHCQIEGIYQLTFNEHSDEVFRDLAFALRVNPDNGGDTFQVARCHFLRCSQAGFSMESGNAIDWHIWHSVFEDCRVGAKAGAVNYHVYDSLFLRSTEADLEPNSAYYGIRRNTSIGSKAFLVGAGGGYSSPITLAGNTIIDPQDPAPITMHTWGPLLMLDNVIQSRAAQTGPVVQIRENLVAIGNTFTRSNPLASSGRSLAFDNQVINPSTLDLDLPELPGPLTNRHRQIIEVPAGASALQIQAAIDAADALRGTRPVVHLPAGNYSIDRTLVIPAGSDVQLVGDGVRWCTQLLWGGEGEGPVLRLAGPSRATLRDFSIQGNNHARGIVADNCDQPGSRILFDQTYSTSARDNNVLVDRLDYTDVFLRDLCHGGSSSVSVKVIGGPRRASGEEVPGRVNIFGGASGGLDLMYEVADGGRLMVQDIWREGGGNRNFMRCTGSGTFTLHGAYLGVQRPDEAGIASDTQPIEITDFRGRLTFLNTGIGLRNAGVLLSGQNAGAEVLLLGVGGMPGYDELLLDHSRDARVELQACMRLTEEGGSYSIPNQGPADPTFLRTMLEQTRTDNPRPLTPLPAGVTDVRGYRVYVELTTVGILLSGVNSAPVLAVIPDLTVAEGSLLVITNTATDPDLSYNTLTYSLALSAPPGAFINPTNGVFTWTPSEAQGPGTNIVGVMVTDNGSPRLSDTNFFTVVVNEANRPPSFDPLGPAEWLSGLDLGPLGDPLEHGQTTFPPDGWIEILAGGSGFVEHSIDGFHFTYQKVKSDFDVRVQLEYLEPRDTWTSAGLMVRESLDPGSRFYCFGALPEGPTLDGHYSGMGGNILWMAHRDVRGQSSPFGTDGHPVPYPNAWLRLKREGNTFTSFRSPNGVDWTGFQALVAPEPYPDELFLGLATSSNNNGPGQTAHARYRNYGPFPQPPPLAIVDLSINEGSTVTFQAPAYDADFPPQTLTFSLDPGAPARASIDPATGNFTWSPGEDHGPGVHPITVRVTDDGSPPLSATQTFTVTVIEVNDPPTVTLTRPTPGTQFIAPATIELEAEASDVDGTIAKVEFFAGSTLLGEAAAAPFRLSWMDVVAGSHTLSAKATDNEGGETISGELTVSVLAALGSAEVLEDGTFRFRLAGEPGRPYVIEMSADLARWTPWQTNTVDTTGWMVVTEQLAPGVSGRYYRARLEP